ncbi:MAG: hypothetical protein COA96_03480 [SAR86 cluster bacterium]|uniref:SRPBCC family protein n=1 Tax=SAR86 cluster bacterium TaxID=2030880 RepID=A0A2A5B6Q7_9GAMM|nr:MAG: hypothetical protein COA96_03480 [SAR86 cluster bacterium]
MRTLNSVASIVSITLICLIFPSRLLNAQISPVDIDLGDSYYYTDHFDITIGRSVSVVWPHILEMSSWMPWMAETNSTSSTVAEGDLIRLYDDFYIEVAKIIPENMVLLVNLPNSQEGEATQGIAMVTIKEIDADNSVVSIFMSRIYYWFGENENQQRTTRESEEFSNSRQTTFKNNFLSQLKQLAES